MNAALTKILRNRPSSLQSDHQRREDNNIHFGELCFYGLIATLCLGAILKLTGVAG